MAPVRTSPRVTHLVPALFGAAGVVGGAERYVLELARHMADLVPTRLVTFGPAAREEQAGALSIRVLGPAHAVRGQASNPFSWSLLGAAGDCDVLHCHQQHILATTAAAVAARVRGRCVFCTDLGGGGWDVSAYVSTDRLFDGHLHISEYSRHVFGHDGLETAHVIYGGVDTARFSPGPSVGAAIDCLFVGRLLPHKGVDVLLDAVPQDLLTMVIGPAPDARYLADLHRIASGKNVVFRHDCTDDEVVDAYRRARCTVLPSVYDDCYGGTTRVPELLGQTLLESMACGTPVIATSVASLPEVVEDGVTGRLVAPRYAPALGAAIRWFLEHPEEGRQMGRAGRERVLARFTWPGVVNSCLAYYSQCTGIS